MTQELREIIIDYVCMDKTARWIADALEHDYDEVTAVARSYTSNTINERKRWLEKHGWNWQFKKPKKVTY